MHVLKGEDQSALSTTLLKRHKSTPNIPTAPTTPVPVTPSSKTNVPSKVPSRTVPPASYEDAIEHWLKTATLPSEEYLPNKDYFDTNESYHVETSRLLNQ